MRQRRSWRGYLLYLGLFAVVAAILAIFILLYGGQVIYIAAAFR